MLDMNKLDDLLTKLAFAARDASATGAEVRQAQVAVLAYVGQHRTLTTHAPFDEAAARAGKSIELNVRDEWIGAKFIGVTSNGRVVVELLSGVVSTLVADRVRMAAPKMRTLYINASAHGVHGFYLSEEAAKKDAEKRGYPIAAYPIQLPDVE